MTVEEGTAAPDRREALVAARVQDHPDLHAAFHLESDGDSEDGHPVGVIGRAVEGIHDPAMARRAGLGPALLGEDRVIGEAAPDAIHDQRLGLPIHLGHEIARAALVADLAERAEAVEKEGAGAPRGVHRDLEEGIDHVP